MKVFFKILKILSLVLVLLLFTAISIAYFYEDEIKLNVINKINSEIKADVNVEEINFSFIKRFPFASLQLKNVFLLEKSDNITDTIFSAQSLYTKFRILDILKKEYNISNIELQNPIIKIKIFKNGSHNFDIFYENNDSIESPLINLEKIKIVDGEIYFTNEITTQFFHLKNNEITAKGVFAPENLEIEFISDFIIKSYITEKKEIISNKFIKTDLNVFFDKTTNKIRLKNANLNYNGMAFSILGEIINKENINLDIALNAEKLDINKALQELPDSSLGQLKNYKLNAKMDLIIDIKGVINKYQLPHVKANFSIYKAKIKHTSTKETIDNIVMRGEYDNGSANNLTTSRLHIQEFSFNSNMGSAKGYLNIDNLLEPKANLNFDADIDLEKIERFLEISSVEKLDGNLKLNLSSSFKILNIYNDNNIDIQFITNSGKADVLDANLVLSNKNEFENIKSSFIFSSEKLKIHSLNCDVNGHSTNFKGSIYNLDKFLLNPIFNNRIIIVGDLSSDFLDVDKLVFYESENNSTSISLKYEIKLNLDVKKAKYLDIDISNFSGNLFYNEDLTKVNIHTASLFEGDITASVEYNTSENVNNLLSIEGKTFGVNIEDIFKKYNNFNQEYITFKNISGKLWSDFNLRILESKDGEWITKSLNLSSSIELKNGELKDVKELNALSKFTKIDDFSEIKFSTLKNDIYIAKEEIQIPQMDINSDKMNISLYGKHKFDNSYEYHFKIRLAEILAKNVRQNQKSEFGEIVDDETGMNIFLKIIGNGEDYEVSYDGKAARQKVKEDLKSEGQEIKDALKKEFGSKKKEKVKTKRDREKEILEKQTKGETVIEWEEF